MYMNRHLFEKSSIAETDFDSTQIYDIEDLADVIDKQLEIDWIDVFTDSQNSLVIRRCNLPE